jgi:branched chain amino acid efflux pump
MRTLVELWPVLAGMSIVTYLTRVGGMGIIGLVQTTPRLARNLQHLATGVLTALVMAGVRDGDAAIGAAAIAAIVVTRITGQLLAAISAAALTAAIVRGLGPVLF